MERGEYVTILAEFVTGGVSQGKLREYVEERLAVLREDPAMSPEKQLLSDIELWLHEADEGLRTSFEVYMRVQSIMDEIILKRPTGQSDNKFVPSVLELPSFRSSTSGVIDPSEARRTATKRHKAPAPA